MADMCSRAWHLSDEQLLTHFNLSFPQNKPWRLCHLHNNMRYALTLALFRKRSEPALHLKEPQHTTIIGPAGSNSASNSTLIHTSATSATPSRCYKSSPNDAGMAASPPVKLPSNLEQLRTPYGRWARLSPFWGPKTLARMPMVTSTSASPDNFELTRRRTRPLDG